MTRSENIEQLWKEDSGETEKRGPLFSERELLSSAFATARSFHSLPSVVELRDEALITRVVPFTVNSKDPETNKKQVLFFEAKGRQTIANDISIAVHQVPKNDKDINMILHEYILNSNGTVVSTDEFSAKGLTIQPTDDDIHIIQQAARAVRNDIQSANESKTRSIESERRRDREEKQARRNRIAKVLGGTAATITVLAGLGAGGYFAWNEWIHKPGMADDAYRATYDKTHYSIDSPVLELDDQQMAILPADEFEAVPSHRDGDNLTSPRIITLDSSSLCAEVDVKDIKQAGVKIGVAEYNPLAEFPVIAYARNETTLAVCAVGDASTESFEDEDLEIAVQIVRD